jgi:hypothetical protein
MNCNVCGSGLGEPVYKSRSGQVLTSLCELRQGTKQVWLCSECTHLRGNPLEGSEQYYANEYRILLAEDDEDQIYESQHDRIVYRTQHQVETLLRKLALPQGAALLDYGCAKASTPRQLLALRPDLNVHLFDVSEMYGEHWNRFVPRERQAVHQTPSRWQGYFDVATSFFALEHVSEPLEMVQRIAALLNEAGVFYGIVPYAFGNVADFVVIDHVNHFTIPSLHRLLNAAGFHSVSIDASAHRGALVFVASKGGAPAAQPDVAGTVAEARGLAEYWYALDGRIRAAESRHGAKPASIYGSGFYGAYISSVLNVPENVQCFLDRSPFQQGKSLFGKPILAPELLPEEVQLLYIGLNPAIARKTVTEMHWLRDRRIELVFLDEAGDV